VALQAKSFQDPTYVGRYVWQNALAAGAAAQSGKFVAFAALQLMSLSASLLIAGTSTYTNTVTGVGTSTINGQQLSLIVITNANAFGTASASLSTATIGPFLSGGYFTSGGTGTGQVSSPVQYALNTTAGTQGQGGLLVPQGALFYIVGGTDATATSAFTIDMQVQPGAPVTI
jgi:hypothetical protein